MESTPILPALSALAHEHRLAIFRLLAQPGGEGLAVGKIGEMLGLPPSTLSFHLKELSHAGLLQSRQEGRVIFYSPDFKRMQEVVAFLSTLTQPSEA